MQNRVCLIIILICLFLAGNCLAQEQAHERPKVGLVFSGGGAKGFAYIGLMKVIEEVGLPIDYIGGTSIGAIMGGLYALGYHPDTIESLIRAQDWEFVISQNIERKYVAYEDKLFSDKYLIKVPIDGFKISLRPSIYESPHIDLMLSNIFSPAYNTHSFDSLPIPFICIATDLVTGDPVVLREGYLPEAIRSSMAIPGYWSPISYRDKYLVDGGVVNNFPVPEVKEMGADIIIGADVQSVVQPEQEDLNNLLNVVDQLIGFLRDDANAEGRAKTDIYINFPMEFSTLDFAEYDSIIAIGEHVARQHYDELKALADSLNKIEEVKPMKRTAYPLDSLRIGRIRFKGASETRRDFVSGYFEGFENSWVSVKEIESSIKYTYGTQYYRAMFPKFQSVNGKNDLILELKPSEQGSLSAGVHFDSDYDGSLLLNLSLRNPFLQQSKLFADLILGRNPRFNALYIMNNGMKPGFGLSVDIYNFEFSEYENNKRINDWDFDNFTTSVFMPMTIRNNIMFKWGGSYEYFRGRPKVEADSVLGLFNGYFGNWVGFFSFDLDARDKTTFTSQGTTLQLKGKYIVPTSTSLNALLNQTLIMYLKYNKSFSLSPSLVFRQGLFLGYTFEKEEPPSQHYFGFGGLNPVNYIENHVPFTGLKFIHSFGLYAGIFRLNLQYQPVKNFYVTGMTDLGINERDWNEVIPKNALFGYGIKLSYDSFIGPIEFSVMGANRTNGISYFFNVGYWF